MTEREITLQEGVNHIKKHGGHFKGKGSGGIQWESDELYAFDKEDRFVLINQNPSATELLEDLK